MRVLAIENFKKIIKKFTFVQVYIIVADFHGGIVQARFASLGLQNILGVLRTKPEKRKHNKVDYSSAPLRRSNRSKGDSAPSSKKESDDIKERLYQEALGQRSNRLKVAVSCHSCRQKNYCDEEDCKRCGDFDMDQPCLGMSDCSICHSSNGLLCRECLKNRYELEEVRANKEWICPHCTEEKGIKPYWFCNRSSCLKKRNIALTGNTLKVARRMGYKSVAHMFMDQLQGAVKGGDDKLFG
ncbi:uncharacterized protein LOC107013647 isoform X1 [Solanum pennellii]|uniref:Uncharacterized protein LOC107013647 isoform X1 n=1 Tax=Solanum pennellii TaxID=28526 RepID=A0ABM1GC23_SOLPN|nr:uncharacterized protein LOC107013647 isoform X1 [Solanum pennellii]